MEQASSKRWIARDRLTISYAVLTLAACIWWQTGTELDQRFNLFLALPLVICLPILALTVSLGYAFLVHRSLRHWRRVASLALAGVLPFAFFYLVPLNSVDYIRFQFERPGYDAQLPATGEARLKAWLFRDQGAFGALVVETYVVFDEADELALPASQWSETWKSRAAYAGRPDLNFGFLVNTRAPYAPCCFRVDHIQGHWYFVVLAFG